MSATVSITSHETDGELYDALASVFGEVERNNSRWVTVHASGVFLTFFAKNEAGE